MTDSLDISSHKCYIEDALNYAGGSHTFEDIREAVDAGRMQFWPCPSSAVVTEIVAYPQYRALNIFLAGGTLEEIEKIAPLILEWGRLQGCTKAYFTGRRGWERSFLSRTGWVNNKLVVMSKDL